MEGGNKKKKKKNPSIVFIVLSIVSTKYQAVSTLLHSFHKAGDSFVLAGEDVTKMHPYP